MPMHQWMNSLVDDEIEKGQVGELISGALNDKLYSFLENILRPIDSEEEICRCE